MGPWLARRYSGGFTSLFFTLPLLWQRIAVIGTVLFGTGSGQSTTGKVTPGLVHTAQWATAANLGFILLALIRALGLPRAPGSERAEENA
jgi:hypothetical protein